jgi:hypothetical protein
MNYKVCGRKQSQHISKYYPRIFPEGLSKTTEDFNEGIRDSNPGHPEYIAGIPTT